MIPDDAPPEPVDTPAEDVSEPEPVVELSPPHDWPEEAKAKWSSIPRELQEFTLERHKGMVSDYTKRSQEIAALEKTYGDLVNTFKPYEQTLRLRGLTPTQVVNQLLAAQSVLDTNPAEGLKWLARSYNVDLTALVPKEQEYIDPSVKALQDEIQSLRAQVVGVSQQTVQTRVSEAAQQIESFQNARNDDGTPKYPYFDQVRALMAPLVNQGKTLEQAYEEVQYAVPEVRARIADEAAKAARAEALKKIEEERKQKAAAAKTASSTIRSRSVSAESNGKPRTLREELEENLRAMTSNSRI